jgi:hypothetical protein
MDSIQPITYRQRKVAAATRSRFFLCDTLDSPNPQSAGRTFVIFTCVYAWDVLCGALPGPYRDADARRYPRACLIPAELAERADIDVARTARALEVPELELLVELGRAEANSRGG